MRRYLAPAAISIRNIDSRITSTTLASKPRFRYAGISFGPSCCSRVRKSFFPEADETVDLEMRHEKPGAASTRVRRAKSIGFGMKSAMPAS